MNKLKVVILLIIFVLSVANVVFADDADTIRKLEKKIQDLEARIDQMENNNQNSGYDAADPFDQYFNEPDPFANILRLREQMEKMMHSPYGKQGGMWDDQFGFDMMEDQDFHLEETEDGYEIQIDISGLNQEKINVEINKHSITLSGEYSQQTQETSENQFRSSQRFGKFTKTVPLPVDADMDRMQSSKEQDKLVIYIPKKE